MFYGSVCYLDWDLESVHIAIEAGIARAAEDPAINAGAYAVGVLKQAGREGHGVPPAKAVERVRKAAARARVDCPLSDSNLRNIAKKQAMALRAVAGTAI